MPIRRLPLNLVNQISAGEVVERPSAALKEILENAIDAQATDIRITVENGGKSLIKTVDNGFGMGPDELPLAVERHATSKLPDDDLVNIRFLGFRGEALPSIGAVARLRLTSRKRGAKDAFGIDVAGGTIGDVHPAALAEGTVVEIRDLFFATPARLKFLKSDASELAACEEIVERLALACPHIDFTLEANGKKRLEFRGRETRVADVMGKDFADGALEIAAERGGARVRGLAGSPQFGRPNSLMQHLFVNGRAVKDKSLSGVLKAAYRNFLFHDRFPAAVIFLDLPPEDVDVNVSPAKTEVRFKNAQEVRGMLITAIRDALESRPLSAPETAGPKLASNPDVEYNGVRETAAPAFYGPERKTAKEKRGGAGIMPVPQSYGVAKEEQPETEETSYPLGTPKAQVLDTFIISETADAVVIVDQHAAHERLTYEKIKNRLGGSQMLLIPESVSLKPRERDAVLEAAGILGDLGFIVEPFEEDGVMVRAASALLEGGDVAVLIRDLAQELLATGVKNPVLDRMADKIARFACHHSIRRGRRMGERDMHSLLREIEANPVAMQCVHGRPTYVVVPRLELEKLFKRR